MVLLHLWMIVIFSIGLMQIFTSFPEQSALAAQLLFLTILTLFTTRSFTGGLTGDLDSQDFTCVTFLAC